MSRRAAHMGLGPLILLAALLMAPQPGRGQPYLEGYRGPYHGRVVDAETGRPLAGAVVVAVWSRERLLPFHSSTVFHAVREALTGPDGTWVLDGRDVEEHAPARTLPPSFDVYYPGYAAITSGAFTRFGGSEIGDMAAGGTVRLPRLRTREDRRLRFPLVPDTPRPFRDVPNLMRLINIERANLGLEPLYGE